MPASEPDPAHLSAAGLQKVVDQLSSDGPLLPKDVTPLQQAEFRLQQAAAAWELAQQDQGCTALRALVLLYGSYASGCHLAGSDIDSVLFVHRAPAQLCMRKAFYGASTANEGVLTGGFLRYSLPHLLQAVGATSVLSKPFGQYPQLSCVLRGVRASISLCSGELQNYSLPSGICSRDADLHAAALRAAFRRAIAQLAGDEPLSAEQRPRALELISKLSGWMETREMMPKEALAKLVFSMLVAFLKALAHRWHMYGSQKGGIKGVIIQILVSAYLRIHADLLGQPLAILYHICKDCSAPGGLHVDLKGIEGTDGLLAQPLVREAWRITAHWQPDNAAAKIRWFQLAALKEMFAAARDTLGKVLDQPSEEATLAALRHLLTPRSPSESYEECFVVVCHAADKQALDAWMRTATFGVEELAACMRDAGVERVKLSTTEYAISGGGCRGGVEAALVVWFSAPELDHTDDRFLEMATGYTSALVQHAAQHGGPDGVHFRIVHTTARRFQSALCGGASPQDAPGASDTPAGSGGHPQASQGADARLQQLASKGFAVAWCTAIERQLPVPDQGDYLPPPQPPPQETSAGEPQMLRADALGGVTIGDGSGPAHNFNAEADRAARAARQAAGHQGAERERTKQRATRGLNSLLQLATRTEASTSAQRRSSEDLQRQPAAKRSAASAGLVD